MKDDFGDRMKMYESTETNRRFLDGLPIYARIDGRGFSKFTKGMNRPYDVEMSTAMQYVTKELVRKTNARVGYTQSDEISLVWGDNIFFDGKVQKICSILSGISSSLFVAFWANAGRIDLVDKIPHFDCRVFQLPSKTEAANAILWREKDATKNAISMAARCYYSHSELQNANSEKKKKMLFNKGVNFEEYPSFFTRGSFFKRVKFIKELTENELEKIPISKRPSGPVIRHEIREIQTPVFKNIKDRVDFIFEDEDIEVHK